MVEHTFLLLSRAEQHTRHLVHKQLAVRRKNFPLRIISGRGLDVEMKFNKAPVSHRGRDSCKIFISTPVYSLSHNELIGCEMKGAAVPFRSIY